MKNINQINLLKQKYPLSRFLHNGDRALPAYLGLSPAEIVIQAASYSHCNNLNYLFNNYELNPKIKKQIFERNMLSQNNWTFCEVLISAVGYYLDYESKLRKEVVSFSWQPITQVLFNSKCTTLLCSILDELFIEKYNILNFILSLQYYLDTRELIWTNTGRIISLEDLPPKNQCISILNLLPLKESCVKDFIYEIYTLKKYNLFISNFRTLLTNLEF